MSRKPVNPQDLIDAIDRGTSATTRLRTTVGASMVWITTMWLILLFEVGL